VTGFSDPLFLVAFVIGIVALAVAVLIYLHFRQKLRVAGRRPNTPGKSQTTT
jgi:hypothetical protein